MKCVTTKFFQLFLNRLIFLKKTKKNPRKIQISIIWIRKVNFTFILSYLSFLFLCLFRLNPMPLYRKDINLSHLKNRRK